MRNIIKFCPICSDDALGHFMRLSAVYHTAAQIANSSVSSKPSRLFPDELERRLLTSILQSRPFLAPKLVVAQRDAILANKRPRPPSVVPVVQSTELLTKMNPRLRENAAARPFMTQRAVTTRDLVNFIQANYLENVAPFERQKCINSALLDLIDSSSANNLRTLMQLLSLYWQVGIVGCRPSIYEARQQARSLLLKALDVHPVTEFAGNGEQVGIPDFERFTTFISTFFAYLGVNSARSDELNVLLLRLQAQSGSLGAVTPEILAQKDQLDPTTLDVYLATLKRSRPDIATLETVKPLLVSRNIGSPAVKFLLPLLPASDVLALLELVDQSAYCKEVYTECQSDILAALRSKTSLAVLFGILHRIQAQTTISAASLTVVMAEAKQQGNESAQTQLKNWIV